MLALLIPLMFCAEHLMGEVVLGHDPIYDEAERRTFFATLGSVAVGVILFEGLKLGTAMEAETPGEFAKAAIVNWQEGRLDYLTEILEMHDCRPLIDPACPGWLALRKPAPAHEIVGCAAFINLHYTHHPHISKWAENLWRKIAMVLGPLVSFGAVTTGFFLVMCTRTFPPTERWMILVTAAECVALGTVGLWLCARQYRRTKVQ